MRSIGAVSARAWLVDRDGGEVGKRLARTLREGGGVLLDVAEDPASVTDEAVREAVGDGRYQFCLVIPPGTSRALEERAEALARDAVGRKGTAATPPPPAPEAALDVHFDPTVQGSFRAAVLAGLREGLLALEVERRASALSATFSVSLRREMERMTGPMPDAYAALLPELRWRDARILSVREAEAAFARPSSVQQNVPAWTLFGMFFIVVPLAGALVRERREATLARLFVAPASFGAVLLGKVAAFVLVCQVQFALMLLAGRFLLPLLGTPTLKLGSHPFALVLLSVGAALAATGYGLLVGALARTYEQASMFGSVSVVIAAALGGVMVPSYAMPPAMQAVSRFSPLNWGLEAFVEVFVRDGDAAAVAPSAALLAGFFVATTFAAWLALVRHRRRGL